MLGGPSETCGPNGSDGLPPQLNIVEPADGQTYEVDGGMAEIAIALEPIDDLSGVAMVQVWIGEGSPGPSMQPPFVWSATLGEGEHAIDFVAVDAFGNEAKERRTVIVGESSDTSGSDGGDDDPHDDAHDDATAGAPTAPSRAGGCRVPGDRSGTGALWLIALLSGIRRRRLAQRTGQ
jgi:hypothetical protein